MSGRTALRRARLWLVVAAVLLVAAVSVAALRTSSGRPLDPGSVQPDGSKALATALAGFGAQVRTTSDPAAARGRIVVVAPQAYTPAQLGRLATQGDLVLFGPATGALLALGSPALPLSTIGGSTAPGCTWAGAVAAGPVDLPAGTLVYTAPGVQSCYGGSVLRGAGWTWLGSQQLLRNDTVSRTGVAALDINAITADRGVRVVTWLLPGTAARGQAAPTTWALFPDGARRAFLWLAALGILLALWRGRRLGRVVTEPLPVLVRAAEVVEGHGRLYLRAGGRDRAAAALRSGAARRLSARYGLPAGTAPPALAAAVAARTGRPEREVAALLSGPPPPDDAALVALARALDELDAADEPMRVEGHR